MIEPRKTLLIYEFYLLNFVLIELSDQLKTTHIHGLALYGFDLDVIQSVLFNGIGEIIKHSQDFGGYLCFKRSVNC